MSYEATEDDLRRMFTVAGTVTSVHLITDPETGEFKGCGYVRMATAEEAKEAVETLDGALLRNRAITVSIARPQKQKPAPGGARRGKGGPGRGPAGGSRGASAPGSGRRASGPGAVTSEGSRGKSGPGGGSRGKSGPATGGASHGKSGSGPRSGRGKK
ncbi:RNA recognition motif domain-containing protein [Geobacter grbiciae]|uniref:RNA recognition motif domain-containing protein n=1 Tax=Geobacter grbiciae TaxID=155042 RepID=UPI001FE798EA